MNRMKKMLALLLALLMAFAVSGCAENLPTIEVPPLPEVTPTPQPTLQVENPTAEGTQADPTESPEDGTVGEPLSEEPPVQIFVSNANQTRYDYDPEEGTELILSFSYDMPRVHSEDFAESCERINEALATVEELFYTGDSYEQNGRYMGYSALLEAAEDNYTYVRENADSELPLEFSDALTARVNRVDDKVLSVVYSQTVYMGGAHGSYGAEALNFDMATGERLSLDRLSSDFDAFADFLTQRMLTMIEEDVDGEYSGRVMEEYLYDQTLEEAIRGLLREGSWYFDNEGLVIFSNLEELGPYAAGMVYFRIPYADLADKIDSQWLFPGQRQGKGKLSVCELSELEGKETEIVDKLDVSEEGVALCLVVEGRIYDITISRVYYVDRFYESAQLWCASALSDCALQLEVVIPEGLPDLLIRYTTADGEQHGKLLSQSGLDGSFMLVDDDIQAVG